MPQNFKTVELTLATGEKIKFKNFGYINFGDGIRKVDQLQRKQKKQIEKMYSDLAAKVDKEISRLSLSEDITVSDSLKKAQLKDLQKEINKNLKEISGKVETMTKTNMKAAATVATVASTKWLNSHGIEIKTGFANVPQDVIANIISGKLYGEKWNFSKRIWGDYNKSVGDVSQIVAKGIAENKSTYDIAKDLEKYVNPKAKKSWDWSKVYPGSKKQIDYNAQRLARTMITHAYEQSTVETSKTNPFVMGILWKSAMAHNTCEICAALNNQIFKPDELPLDHPNGQCDFIPVINQSDEDIVNALADWVHGKSDDEFNAKMEVFAEKAGFKKSDVKTEFIENKLNKQIEKEQKNEIKTNSKVEAKDFQNAKNLDEAQKVAEKYCQQNIGDKTFKGKVDLKGISVEHANEITRALADVYGGFNGMPFIGGIKTIDPNSATGQKVFTSSDALMAYSPVYQGIYINKNVLKNAETLEKYNKEAKEAYNYVLQNIDKLQGSQRDVALRYQKAGRDLVGNGSVHDYLIHEMGHHAEWELLDVKTNNSVGSRRKEFAENISGYATASKGEYIAESFAAYVKGERDILDPEFVEFLDKKRKK